MLAYAIIALVAAERLVELAYARRNTARLIAAGGVEAGAAHYPAFVLLHAAWLAGMALSVDRATPVEPWLIGLFGALQLARLWIVASLGRFWTTRVITLPGAALVRRGPYRYLSHPNYLVVGLEIAALPLAFGLVWQALIFSALNGLLLRHRMRVETAALAPRQAIEKGTAPCGVPPVQS
jgi:methyltransferase